MRNCFGGETHALEINRQSVHEKSTLTRYLKKYNTCSAWILLCIQSWGMTSHYTTWHSLQPPCRASATERNSQNHWPVGKIPTHMAHRGAVSPMKEVISPCVSCNARSFWTGLRYSQPEFVALRPVQDGARIESKNKFSQSCAFTIYLADSLPAEGTRAQSLDCAVNRKELWGRYLDVPHLTTGVVPIMSGAYPRHGLHSTPLSRYDYRTTQKSFC